MKPLRDLISADQVMELASRSNFRYGQQMAEEAEFTVLKENTYNIVAKVKHGNHDGRTVELMSTSKGFRWKCTCTSKKGYFCNHAVAVAMWKIKGT